MDGEKIYEEAGSSPWVPIVGWLILMFILYFDFASSGATNPVVLFSPVLLWLIVVMPHDNWESIKRFFGLHLPSGKQWLIIPILFLGSLTAWIIVKLINSIGMPNAIFVAGASSGTNIFSGIIYVIMANTVVAVGENFFVIGSQHYFGNWLYSKFHIDPTSSAFVALLISISLWCSAHIFHYGFAMGLGAGVFIGIIIIGTVMFGLGYIFEPIIEPSPRFALELYPIYFSLAFHLTYNVLISLNMAAIPISFLGISIIS